MYDMIEGLLSQLVVTIIYQKWVYVWKINMLDITSHLPTANIMGYL